jgi:hypothetical protein
MPIVVDSSQWTGEAEAQPSGPHVWAEFPDRESCDRAVAALLGTPPFSGSNTGQVPPPDDAPLQADARNQRQLGVGIGASAAAMAAAGIVIATGGAARPAAAAAAAAGGATAAAGEAVGKAAEPRGSGDPEEGRPHISSSGEVLAIRADTEEKREAAERILREAGATRVWTADASAAERG